MDSGDQQGRDIKHDYVFSLLRNVSYLLTHYFID